MKIAIIGSRGIPAAYGGFETFAEELSVRLVESGVETIVICQKSIEQNDKFKGVQLLYSKYSKAQNPIKFYFDSLKLAIRDSDLILVCGVGGAIFYPFLKTKGKILISHLDGREELRGRYSFLKKLYVKIANGFAKKYSDHLIADSFSVLNHWKKFYQVSEGKISAIEFGANIEQTEDNSVLRELSVFLGAYFLIVCRMVPENNIQMIIDGFLESESSKKLVLVGDISESFRFGLRNITQSKIIFSEGIYDRRRLFSIRKNCFAYVHGHTVGGTNPSLLEAMAAGNICICHDNEFNHETTKSKMFYFKNVDELAKCIRQVESLSGNERQSYSLIAESHIVNYYNWKRITNEYLELFKRLKHG